MFSEENRLGCIAATGIDPEKAYDHFMIEVQIGGPSYRLLVRNLERTLTSRRPVLSPRKKQVMILYANGYTRQQIADELGIGVETVKTYMQQIQHLLDARNGTHAVALCIVLGLLNSPPPKEES